MKNKGFTLVELSIVLVIIGLLIGGILVAQSLIDSAKISSQVRQLSQFDAAVMSFIDRYKTLPGDAKGFGGNGDKALTLTHVSGNWTTAHGCEIANFWNNLDQDSYAASACSGPGARPTTKGANKNVPESDIGREGSFFVASAISTDGRATASSPQNYYAIFGPEQAQATVSSWYRLTNSDSTNSSTTPSMLLSLDNKADDGLANSGFVYAGSADNAGSGHPYVSLAPVAACSSGATYEIANNGYECTPVIRIGGSAGVGQ